MEGVFHAGTLCEQSLGEGGAQSMFAVKRPAEQIRDLAQQGTDWGSGRGSDYKGLDWSLDLTSGQ